GTLYNGQTTKGIVYILTPIVLITMLAHGKGSPVFLALLLAGFYAYQFIDAIMTATAINRRALVGKEEEEFKIDEVPEALKSGSIFWGTVLIVLGGILLLANFNIISYNTIFDFWPLILIVIALKLITDYFTEKKKES
ncbi:MAG: hypothetical protein KAU91_01715, partial [Candidatus Aminicenantes bacterium]|nr:hypothetical protein [Candidatus Aminicenantes bacterium]